MDFFHVRDGRKSYYGGDQAWFPDQLGRRYGCGIIACTNVLLGLLNGLQTPESLVQREKQGLSEGKISKEDYLRLVRRSRHSFLLLPKFGINGPALAHGMNRMLQKAGLPYHCHWGTGRRKLWSQVERMLAEGIPVVIAVGPNSPNIWGTDSLNLYLPVGQEHRKRGTTRAHYMTVTSMEGDWLTVSSWGRKYQINKEEYMQYARTRSNLLYTNILVVEPL